MNYDTLLLELGTEELPPTSLKTLSEAFTQSILSGLVEQQLITPADADQAQAFASPRRLALLVPNVAQGQPDQVSERRGPAVAAAFDEAGQATPAAQGFARSCGVEVADLQRLKTDKGEWLSYTVNEAGKQLAELLNDVLAEAVKRLPIPKRMRWGSGNAEFVRPAHWLVALHGNDIVPLTVLSLNSGRQSRGHRFHSSGEISFDNAEDYANTLLEQGSVVADFAARQAMIEQQISELAGSLGAKLDSDQALLDEVTALVEQPTALLGSFDESFLAVPSECLISAMRDHQKYFHLRNAEGALLPNFITVSNIQSKNPERVTSGNERVLRARLSDAQFFWESDRKTTLADQLPRLDAVLFHVKLGSLGSKAERLVVLATYLAEQIGANQTIAARAAKLAKADLVSDMVGEFDKLQGLMGHYYADLDGEDKLVGESIEQHYWPRYAGDQLPESKEAQAVALADRLDSLVGIYAAGEVPTGDKDPYSLRRAALGILRILVESELPLSLVELVRNSSLAYQNQGIEISADTQADIVQFIQGRATAYYQAQDIATNAINAVAACSPEKPLDFDQRLKAVRHFDQLAEARDLAAANKRISNILKKQSEQVAGSVTASLMTEPAEQTLLAALESAEQVAGSLFNQGDYTEGLKALANLRAPVDDFFESVMVMSDDLAERGNRLALLQRLQALFLRVADIAQLQS